MKIQVPELSLVVLIGPSGSGKSTFARKHFRSTEVLSSDFFRGLVSDDENDQTATTDAFEALHYVAAKRLSAGRIAVVDATNVQQEARRPLVALAREHHVLPVAIVLNLPEKVCQERNQDRPDRTFGPHVVRQHIQQLRRSLRSLKREGFRHVYVLNGVEDVEAAEVERTKLWTNKREATGPFDIIGDVHGCFDELTELLRRLGYEVTGGNKGPSAKHPEGRKAVFLGDLVDRGPASPAVLRLVMSMLHGGAAFAVPGNHDIKLMRKLQGKDVRLTHGLAETMEQLESEPEEFRERVISFVDGLVSHFVLDGGQLVVAHAGLKESLQGRASGKVREFALFGETTGETDEFGLPVRYPWAQDYRGKAMVVYGHTPVPAAEWVNGTICIDTGCVFGGKLTALRYPERELVQVQAQKVYYQPVKPFLPETETEGLEVEQRPYNDLLDIGDVSGKRIVITRHFRRVTVREENAAAALEIMSRFAADPRWLIYLPPTMSPSDTCKEGAYLEHPRETFAYFRHEGVPKVICEEKHMGSRSIIVLCKDESVAAKRFGISGAGQGMVYTRTGRPFFKDETLHAEVLKRLSSAMGKGDFWDRFETDWVCLDAEIMPWSVKAQELLHSQYAAVGSSARAGLTASVEALERAVLRAPEASEILSRFRARCETIGSYVDAYRRYCWPVSSISDLKIAPFHLLATEGKVHVDQSHTWHMTTLAELCAVDPGFLAATRNMVVDLTLPESEQGGGKWWEEMTSKGGEGMVVKPLEWIVRTKQGLSQPALKCRGREYLRIIYGPEYTLPEHLERLRARGLKAKRSLALREYALGLEALHRFVDREPLYRVHECVFGVLAMESEPVDPRL